MNTSTAQSISFEELYRRDSPRIYRRVLSLVACPQEAEDLTQETFVKAWRAWPPTSTINLYGWLYRIATHTALDTLRRDRLVSRVPLEAACWHLAHPAADPQTRYEGAAGRLEAALSHVPKHHLTLLLLSADYTAPELARVLGVNPRTLASQLSRLKARAARLYAQEVSA